MDSNPSRSKRTDGTFHPRNPLEMQSYPECVAMLWTIVVILLILWLLGFSFHVAGGLIHILLVIALVVGLIQLFSGRRVV